MPAHKLDAIALLKADHRKVEDLFAKFGAARPEAPTIIATDIGGTAHG
jgi:hypothetical protein